MTSNNFFKAKFGLLIGTFILTFFNACEQGKFHEENFGPQTKGEIKAKASADDDRSLGKQHNYALDEIAQRSDFPDSVSGQEAYNTNKGYLKDSLNGSHFLDYSNTKSHYKNMVTDTASDRQEYVALNTDYFVDYIQSNASFSSEVNPYLNDLKAHYSEFTSVADLQDELAALEDSVKEDSTLLEHEEEMLISLGAVARKSLAYWDDARSAGSHDWYSPFTEDLSSSEQEDFMLNLSIESTCIYAMVFIQTYDDGYIIDNAHSAALNQAATQSTGPVTVATTNW